MRFIMAVIVLALTCIDLSWAQGTHEERELESLKGIPGVRVVVEDTESDAQADGLTKAAILAAVQDTLVSRDIRILTESEWSETPSKPWLYIRVDTHKDDPHPQYVVSLRVQLLQKVSLVHRPEHTMTVITWEDGATVIVGIRKLREVATALIKPKVNDFARDFRFMNPK